MHAMSIPAGKSAVRAGLGAAALLIVVMAGSSAWAQAPGEASACYPNCNRICLIGMLHSYLDALSHKDRGLAPFARNARYTENNVEMPLGEGLGVRWAGCRPRDLKWPIRHGQCRLVRHGAGAWHRRLPGGAFESCGRTNHGSRIRGPALADTSGPFRRPGETDSTIPHSRRYCLRSSVGSASG